MMNKWDELESRIINCRRCPRLVEWREEVAATKRRAYRHWVYWGKPVLGFGDHQARVMVIGLAPGAHGSNRTGRMFTGDASGDFLYTALHETGFANQPGAEHLRDGLQLSDLFISAAGRCAPPANKPTREELNNCQEFLLREIALLENLQGFVVLGKIAFDRLKLLFPEIYQTRLDGKFSHGGLIEPENSPWVICSYHPSQQNTQTGRLTKEMFSSIWENVRSRFYAD